MTGRAPAPASTASARSSASTCPSASSSFSSAPVGASGVSSQSNSSIEVRSASRSQAMWTVDVWSASKQELKSKLMAPVANCHRRTHAPQYTSAALLEMQRYIKVERLSDLEVRPCKVAITGGCLLVARVDDLYPSIFARVRSSRILQLGLAVADRHQVARVDAIFFEKQPLDRLGAAFGQPLIVCVAAFGVSMPGKDESVALQLEARQSMAECVAEVFLLLGRKINKVVFEVLH